MKRRHFIRALLAVPLAVAMPRRAGFYGLDRALGESRSLWVPIEEFIRRRQYVIATTWVFQYQDLAQSLHWADET